ncbi:MAG: anti-sigma factor [Acidobacteriota bacterium]|nr:anti-sigma factor [Acidobacteriota bacterium]
MTEREPMSGTPDCNGDAAAYVLGALEPHEADAFRAHLQECAVCRDEVEALGGVVQALPAAAHQYAVPNELRRRVMRAVHGDPQTTVRAGARRRAGGRRLIAGVATAAVAAVAVVVGLELSTGAAGRVIPARVSGIAGRAELRVTDGRAELLVQHLSAPAHGQVYEVWLQSGKAAPVPASVLFGVNRAGDAEIGIPVRIHGVDAVMVTAEPLGGTSKPTRAPVIVARLD